MRAPLGALISVSTAISILATEKSSKDMPKLVTCDWCGSSTEALDTVEFSLCDRCRIIAIQALDLGRQVAQEVRKGGIQLYIAIEKTGQETALLSAKRWSPLESLESVDSADDYLTTYLSPQE